MITKNYIKMCEGAEEIQKCRYIFLDKPINIFCDMAQEQKIIYCLSWGEWSDGKKRKNWDEEIGYNLIHLPTQEQLQEMMLTKNILENTWALGWLINNVCCFMENKYEYVELPEHYAFQNFNEVTELWLAFVMYRKYNKIWNGKEWINETT